MPWWFVARLLLLESSVTPCCRLRPSHDALASEQMGANAAGLEPLGGEAGASNVKLVSRSPLLSIVLADPVSFAPPEELARLYLRLTSSLSLIAADDIGQEKASVPFVARLSMWLEHA